MFPNRLSGVLIGYLLDIQKMTHLKVDRTRYAYTIVLVMAILYQVVYIWSGQVAYDNVTSLYEVPLCAVGHGRVISYDPDSFTSCAALQKAAASGETFSGPLAVDIDILRGHLTQGFRYSTKLVLDRSQGSGWFGTAKPVHFEVKKLKGHISISGVNTGEIQSANANSAKSARDSLSMQTALPTTDTPQLQTTDIPRRRRLLKGGSSFTSTSYRRSAYRSYRYLGRSYRRKRVWRSMWWDDLYPEEEEDVSMKGTKNHPGVFMQKGQYVSVITRAKRNSDSGDEWCGTSLTGCIRQLDSNPVVIGSGPTFKFEGNPGRLAIHVDNIEVKSADLRQDPCPVSVYVVFATSDASTGSTVCLAALELLPVLTVAIWCLIQVLHWLGHFPKLPNLARVVYQMDPGFDSVLLRWSSVGSIVELCCQLCQVLILLLSIRQIFRFVTVATFEESVNAMRFYTGMFVVTFHITRCENLFYAWAPLSMANSPVSLAISTPRSPGETHSHQPEDIDSLDDKYYNAYRENLVCLHAVGGDLKRLASERNVMPRMLLMNLASNDIRLPGRLEIWRRLTHLNLFNNDIQSLCAPAQASPHLVWLCCANNELRTVDLDKSHCLPKLEYLDLHSNELKKINSLAGCPNLKELDLSNNDLNSVSGLSRGLHNLESLNLDSNELGDMALNGKQGLIAVINALPSLRLLQVCNNNFSEDGCLRLRQEVRDDVVIVFDR